MKQDLKQQITQFFFQGSGITGIDGFQHLIHFFKKMGLEGLAGLFFVPGATIRSSQSGHD